MIEHLVESRGRSPARHARARTQEDARGTSRAEPLGTNDGICFTPETGEVKDVVLDRTLQRWEMQAAARELLPDSRLRICYRHRLPGAESVRVYRRQRAEKVSTYYADLQVCGLVWECPVCAAKIAERKRQELLVGMRRHREGGGSVLLMTLTVPHRVTDEAFGLSDRLLGAFRRFQSGKRAWTRLLPGYVGSVRALEVTHGDNGWHPHLHVLVFLSGSVDELAAAESVLLDRWRQVVLKVGLGEVNEHGLRLDDGHQAGEYISKWGLADELTKANIKLGKRAGRTPFQILADYAAGDRASGVLFQEFAAAFRGRSQLQWSRGLRELLDLDAEQSDQELAEEKDQALDTLAARIQPADWRVIRRHELRGQVLVLLRSADWSAVQVLLNLYRDEPVSSLGVVI